MERRTIIILFIVSLCAAALFAGLIRLADPLLDRFPHLPDQGPAWYFWKLPEATMAARISAWVLYGLHQLLTWLFVRGVLKSRDEKSSKPLRLTVIALAGNLAFIVLHFIQTHLFYDGLAQDMPIFTSQDSVIGMLMIVLAMLVPVRGLFFGKKIGQPVRAMEFIRRYHGYFIGWALVYTFWFHPMDGDWQLVFGFLYMFFLFIQVSFAATFIHRLVPWITLLEVFVAVHGTLVAFWSGSAIWPMFLFGFLLVFIVTQLFGLKMPAVFRVIAIVLYAIGVGVVYYFRGYAKLFEITFIPLTLYAGAVLLPLLVALGQRLVLAVSGAAAKKGEEK
jgi:hypothetical protein